MNSKKLFYNIKYFEKILEQSQTMNEIYQLLRRKRLIKSKNW